MKKIAFLAIVLLSFAAETQAQNWKPGVIVLANGDSVKGDLSEQAMGNYECRLKKSDESIVSYAPDQVVSFYIPGEMYFERVALKNSDEEQLVFMNVIVSGRADLLEHDDVFYVRTEDAVLPLETIEQKRMVDTKEYVSTFEKFKQTLDSKFVDCPDAQKAISSTVLSRRSLTKLFLRYNLCFDPTIKVQSQRKARKPQFSLGLKYNFMSTKLRDLTDEFSRTATESTFDDKVQQSFLGGYIQYNTYVPNGLAIQLAFHRVSFQYNSRNVFQAPEQLDNGGTRQVDLDFKYNISYSSFVMPLTARYSFFNDKKVRPFVAIGTGIQSNKKFVGMGDFTHITDAKNRKVAIGTMNSFAFSFMWGAGVNYHVQRFTIGGSVHLEYLKSPVTLIGVSRGFNPKQNNVLTSLSIGYSFAH